MSDQAARRALDLATALGGPLLGLDTSTATTSLCLALPGAAALHTRFLSAASLPSESLAQGLADILQEADLAPKALKAMVVGLGPGSFTGLRVGLATIKGLALGTGVPIYGVSSLAVMSASAGPGYAATILDARRGEWYAALYTVREGEAPKAVVEDTILMPEGAVAMLRSKVPQGTPLRITGDTAHACVEQLASANATEVPALVDMVHGLLLAEADLRAGRAESLATLVPRYMRISEAERQLLQK